MNDFIAIKNNETISLKEIPLLAYSDFLSMNTTLQLKTDHHCVNYFGYRSAAGVKLICCMANDTEGTFLISASGIPSIESTYPSFSAHHLAFQCFERELHEQFGIKYADHPWLKPLRFEHDRQNIDSRIENYPFYQIKSEELHEVGVGPIHAGIIEPGHFRFICNGEQILHLEIQLGFQHRGIEQLFLSRKNLLQRTILAESIAGDTVAGHTTAFVNLWERMCNQPAGEDLQFSRTVALELERIAIHTGDLSAISNDIAYQLGSSVFGRLRTPIINFFQSWCGNRLAKGLLRAGHNHFPFTPELAEQLEKVMDHFEPDYMEMFTAFKTQASVLERLEKTGVVTPEQMYSIGAVGLAARASGLDRDIRNTHPHDMYQQLNHEMITKHHGDVYSRTQLRNEEILQSMAYIRRLIKSIPKENHSQKPIQAPEADSFTIALTEGWRGEICHCAVTDENGELMRYKIKDPSLHNWLALALAVRNNEISDFPICNKSFNLSYCGHDL